MTIYKNSGKFLIEVRAINQPVMKSSSDGSMCWRLANYKDSGISLRGGDLHIARTSSLCTPSAACRAAMSFPRNLTGNSENMDKI